LEAAGADLDRVHIIERVTDEFGPRPFNLVADLARLDQVLQELRKPRLVIVDPINACMGSTYAHAFNPNSVPQVRALICRLEALVTKPRVALGCVTPLTRARGGQ